MTTPEQAQPLDEAQRAFVIAMLQKMPDVIGQSLLADPNVRASLRLPVEETHRLFDHRFASAAVFTALRDVANDRPVDLQSVDGSVSIDEARLEQDGSGVLVIGDQGARFANVALLSDDKIVRQRALDRLFRSEELVAETESRIRTAAEEHPLDEAQFLALEIEIEETPKATYRRFHAEAKDHLTFETLMPDAATFFERLLGLPPPETIGRYRTAWLERLIKVNTDRQARCIALAAPISVLRGSLVAPIAKDLDREVRLRLATFLAGCPDPLSRLAGFQIAAADFADPDFKAIGDNLLPQLLDPEEEGLSLLNSFLIMTGCIASRRQTLEGWPVYAKRLAWYQHASLLARTFGNGQLSASDLNEQIGAPFAQNYRLAELCDARTIPFNMSSAPTVAQLHLLIVARIIETLAELSEEDRPTDWSSAVDPIVASVTTGPTALLCLFPAPFEPFEDNWSGLLDLPEDKSEETLKCMRSEAGQEQALNDLFGLANAFEIAPERRDTFVAQLLPFLTSLSQDFFTIGADCALQVAARWKQPDLADSVIELALQRATTGSLTDPSTAPRFCLVGAASQNDPDRWAQKVGEYALGFAFALNAGSGTRNMLAAIEILGDYAPTLRAHLAPARSFALLASGPS